MVILPRKSLHRSFVFTLVGVVTVILMIFSGAVIGFNSQKKEVELQQQLYQTLQLAETVLPEVVWRGELQSINNILKTIIANNAVICARILVDNQTVVSLLKPPYKEKKFVEFEESSYYLISSADIIRQGTLTGRLQIVMSRDEIHREILSTAFSIIGLFIILVVAILFTSVLILRHYVFRPLAKLQRSANLIANGNLDTPIDIDRNDEIGTLASAFGLMAKRLEESFDTLEHKVIERTVEVSQAKIMAEKTNQNLLVLGAELQALLDNSPVGILFVDNERVIKRVNAELESITGYSSDELIGQSITLFSRRQQRDGQESEKCFPELNMKGQSKGRLLLSRKDGSEITCWIQGRSISVSSDLEGVIWSVEDITNRLQMEEELLKGKKLESIGVLAGGLGHDFNNILFAVIGNLSLAERISEKNSPVREHILAAREASIRAKELTSKLLAFACGREPVKETASLPELVKEAAELVVTGSNVKCIVQTPEHLWSVSMDRVQISQVVRDLVTNAKQSMPEGGTIYVSYSNSYLGDNEVVGLPPGRYVRVSLTDRGRGIACDNLERVFDPYFSTKDKDSTNGSGLGLAIVHRIMAKHDGKITVESIQGQGTTFTLYLPAREYKISEQIVDSPIVPVGKGAVLVLDEDRDIQKVISDMLQPIGYRAQPVYDGDSAIQQMRGYVRTGNRFFAIIMDINIQGENGWKKLLSTFLELDPEAKVIASSDDPDAIPADKYHEYGFCSFLPKPFKLLEVNRVLSSIDKTKLESAGDQVLLSAIKN